MRPIAHPPRTKPHPPGLRSTAAVPRRPRILRIPTPRLPSISEFPASDRPFSPTREKEWGSGAAGCFLLFANLLVGMAAAKGFSPGVAGASAPKPFTLGSRSRRRLSSNFSPTCTTSSPSNSSVNGFQIPAKAATPVGSSRCPFQIRFDATSDQEIAAVSDEPASTRASSVSALEQLKASAGDRKSSSFTFALSFTGADLDFIIILHLLRGFLFDPSFLFLRLHFAEILGLLRYRFFM